jgi:hypothetical protein
LPITSYSLEYSMDELTWTALCGQAEDYTLTYYTHSGLTTGDKMFYRYLVRSDAGWSSPSEVTETFVGTEPHQMTAPSAVIDQDPTLVKFSWSALSSETNGGIPTVSYRLEILNAENSFTDACAGV